MRLVRVLSSAVVIVAATSGTASAAPRPVPAAAVVLGRVPGNLSGGVALVNRTLYVSGGVLTDNGIPTIRLARVSSARTVLVQRDFVGIASAPAVGQGSLWLTTSSGARGVVQPNSGFLLRFDPLTLRRTGRVEVGQGAGAPVTGAGSVFVAVGNQVLRVDSTTMRVTARHTFRAGNTDGRLTALQFAYGRLWVLDDPNGDGAGPTRVLGIDPKTMRQHVEISVPGHDPVFAAGSSRLWIVYGTDDGPSRVREVRTSTGRVVLDQRISRLPHAVDALAADAANTLWYVTRAGALGRIAPDGSRTTAAVDLQRWHPAGLAVSTTRVAVPTADGILELAPS